MYLSEERLQQVTNEQIRFVSAKPYLHNKPFENVSYLFSIHGRRVQFDVLATSHVLSLFCLDQKCYSYSPDISKDIHTVLSFMRNEYISHLEQTPDLRLRYLTGDVQVVVENVT